MAGRPWMQLGLRGQGDEGGERGREQKRDDGFQGMSSRCTGA